MDILSGGDREPKRGDFLRTTRSIYRVLSSRKVRRRDPAAVPRFALHVRRVEEMARETGIPLESYSWQFKWHPRNKRKINFEQFMRRSLR